MTLLNWSFGLAGVAVIALAAWWRRRARSVPARVVSAEPDTDGAVVVRFDEPGRAGVGDTPQRPCRRPEVGTPLALAAGDRVRVRRPRHDRRHVEFVLTPMLPLCGMLALYGLILIWVGVGTRPPASVPAAVAAGFAVIPLLAAGYPAGVSWFWLTARRVPGTVVDHGSHIGTLAPSAKPRGSWRALISYEVDGHARQRWSPGKYMRKPSPGRSVSVLVDRRNPGNAVTFGGDGIVSAVSLAVVGFGFGWVLLWFVLSFLDT